MGDGRWEDEDGWQKTSGSVCMYLYHLWIVCAAVTKEADLQFDPRQGVIHTKDE